MRFPSIPTFIRTLYAFSNTTARAPPKVFNSLARPTALRASMPIPFIGALFSTAESRKMTYPVQKTEKEWEDQLGEDVWKVVRGKGTEAPGSHAFDKHSPTSGVYTCVACNAPLYKANHKFKSACGWPAFFDAVPGAVTRHEDRTFGMARTEIVCSNCGGHLGHVFKGEGYATPTDERHCVNGVSLKFNENDPITEGKKSEL
ncbi:Putative peptide methionine sulfoxide reductase MrsB domain, Mss4-like superfamily [Septoria linicola]|uniref:Peptide-methionine (R)-S-oxide reductase n=1 Tax=Septoria linicola TaxID=215465 RepID=A0A9Q9EGV1_9PEZI|nr:putative peptide methionine sulfoxide reductase MrsB domain, Mss4-like superfamily [Septoria linicola]USW48648.1 Putative peptide methionine sulfoxide reductase MrsB domain, Mss4-like superfamily [Septoria linicola]